jgi:hypothetical protein
MKVRTLRKHDSAYGDVYTKHPGKVYEHPHPQALIDGGLVEDAAAPKAAKAAPKAESKE